jgi:hypothetical protein
MTNPVAYPSGAIAQPILISPGQTQELGFQFDPTGLAAAGANMYLNFVVFGTPPANAANVAPAAPQVAVLHNVAGNTYTVLNLGSFVAVPTDDGGVVDVELVPHPNGLAGVYQLLFSPEQNYKLSQQFWKIRFGNQDANVADPPIQVTFVVDSADTVLPWIGLPTSISGATDFATALTLVLPDGQAPQWTTSVQLICGQKYDLTIPVYNYGTAPLSINIAAPIASGQFAVQPKSTTIPPGGFDTIVVELSSQSNPVALNSAGSPAIMKIPSVDTLHQSALSFYATVGNVEFVFALDVSGSMGTNDSGLGTRLSTLQGAFTGIMGQLQQFSGEGTWGALLYPSTTTAGGNTQTVQTVTEITSTSSITLNYPPTNSTPMGPAIYVAMGDPANSATSDCGFFVPNDANPQHKAAFQFDHRWLILMTDGLANLGPDPSTFPSSYYGDRRVKAITIGFGLPSQTSPTTLSTIASKSGGVYIQADPVTGDPSSGLTNQFFKAVTAGLALTFLADPSAVLPMTAGARNLHSTIVTDYDRKISFVLSFLTEFEAASAQMTLITPSGQQVTSQTASTFGMTYAAGPLSKAYFANFLTSKQLHASGFAGTWTIVVTYAPPIGVVAATADPAPAAAAPRNIRYAYQVIVDSALTLYLGSGAGPTHAGNPIALSASLAVNGLPVRDASVKAQIAGSGQGFDNWLASQTITQDEYNAALRSLSNLHDVQALFVKTTALAAKGIVFPGLGSNLTYTMAEDPKTGTYRTSFATTKQPGTYQFLVSATGKDNKGNLFTRQQTWSTVVTVLPDAASTVVSITYQVVSGQMQATLQVWPQDRFGNVVLVDPAVSQAIKVLLAGGAVASGPLKWNLDSSYIQIFIYPLTATPVIGISINGNTIIPSIIPPEFSKMLFVNQVVKYVKGREGKPGATLHTDPTQALGDPSRKSPACFVSLGGLGSVEFDVKGQVIHAKEVTVFIAPGTGLRAYSVEVLAVHAGVGWLEVGRSRGGTQTFSLVPKPFVPPDTKGWYIEVSGLVAGETFDINLPLTGRLHAPPVDPLTRIGSQGIAAVRVNDLSNVAPDGVSVAGVGFTP